MQRQLSNGTWVDVKAGQEAGFIAAAVKVEQWLAPNLGREPLDAQGIEAALAAGRTVIIGTEWHAHIRAAAPAPRVRLDDYPEGRKLACGCVVYSQHEVMSASLG
ncbi:MAG: hypothetical protein KAT00_13025, partial [Planctomycetes bacterium]|nr:hypothetical protein [Planctomycetota bacterium]